MGWPEITFIVLYVFMATTNTALTFNNKGVNIGLGRFFIELLIAAVTFGLLITGGFFN
jgi:hypothetical protein